MRIRLRFGILRLAQNRMGKLMAHNMNGIASISKSIRIGIRSNISHLKNKTKCHLMLGESIYHSIVLNFTSFLSSSVPKKCRIVCMWYVCANPAPRVPQRNVIAIISGNSVTVICHHVICRKQRAPKLRSRHHK